MIGDVRGKGLLLGVEFVEDLNSMRRFPATRKVTNLVIQKAMEKGLLLAILTNAGERRIQAMHYYNLKIFCVTEGRG
ncbi:hypothetical protein KHA80_21855 [Anaerobacillus sp. HL2]|nr:hypothetical protein KHA80_21855 [Anaerobacillus sp. HL2]